MPREAARSLYAETARPAPPTRPLEGDASAEVVIVGAGYTGLSAALHLAEAGSDALVIEASDIGFGASGRNGGQINPGLKWEPQRLIAAFGRDLGERMARLGDEAPALVFDLVDRHGIDCEAHRGGTIRAASRAKAETGIREHVRQGAARGADIAWLDSAAMTRLTGASAYVCGSLDRRGGNLNPLAFARGLAEAAMQRGARIATQTRAICLARKNGGWSVETDRGVVSAKRVLLASNGYTDALWPGLAANHRACSLVHCGDGTPAARRRGGDPAGPAVSL